MGRERGRGDTLGVRPNAGATQPNRLTWLAPAPGQAVSLTVLAVLLGSLVIVEIQRPQPPWRAVALGCAGLAVAAGWVPPTIRDTCLARAFGYAFLTAGGLGLSMLGLGEYAAVAITAGVFLASAAWRTLVSTGLFLGSVAAFDAIVLWQTRAAPTVIFLDLLWAYVFAGGRALRRWRLEQHRAGEALVARADAAALRERARIARDIHDVLGHNLSMLAVQIETARILLPGISENSEARQRIEKAGKLLRHGLEELADVIGTLRADAEPWPTRIGELIAAFEQDSGVCCHLTVEGDATVPVDAQVTVYRAIQEALTNACKHGNPTEVEVHLRCVDGEVELHVVNDGAGSSVGPIWPVGAGYGLPSMRNRVETLGGSLEAGAVDGRFRLHLRLPL